MQAAGGSAGRRRQVADPKPVKGGRRAELRRRRLTGSGRGKS
jgi:hypothetical protein